MKMILGLKKEMTQIFNSDSGDVIPVTVIQAGPCRVVKIKRADSKDGYNAVTIGLAGKKKLGKRELGQLKDLGNLQYLKEFRTDEPVGLKRGDTISVNTFEVGNKVKIVGTSKGKGFQGVIKRHGFHGQKATHGNKDQERAHGSIGATEPARVFPGMKMPGHMGHQRVTVKNLEIAKIDTDKNELYVKGAVPGAKNGLLIISSDGEIKINMQHHDSHEQENGSEESKNKEISKPGEDTKGEE